MDRAAETNMQNEEIINVKSFSFNIARDLIKYLLGPKPELASFDRVNSETLGVMSESKNWINAHLIIYLTLYRLIISRQSHFFHPPIALDRLLAKLRFLSHV